MSNTADEQAPRRQLESWAADRVKAWGELQKDDYDFRSWAEGASKNCLSAGAVYEYARESRKLRGLLALMNPKRPRNDLEIMRPGSIDGREPEPGEIESYPTAATWLPCSFEGLDEHEAERALGGFLYCLGDLADYLADNISFGELFHTKRDELEKAFCGLDKLENVGWKFSYFIPVGAVEPAFEIQAQQQATTQETLIDQLHPERSDQRQRIIQDDGSEVVALRIRWGDFNNKEIAAAMKEFAGENRPKEPRCKEPQRKGRGRQDSVRAALDFLSAMRLASHFPKTSPVPDKASPGEGGILPTQQLAAYLSGDPIEFPLSAIDLFKEVRLGGRGKEMAESNFDVLIVEARNVFKQSFPFGEDAANAPTLAQRVMMKSERISSQAKA